MPDTPHINGPGAADVALRDYVEALFNEQQRQREIADTEREKAASALRDEQYRAMQQAEREREKSAESLRKNLEAATEAGDERLREHIANQIQQINGALASAEKLEVQRMQAAKDGTEAVRREMQIITQASQAAVQKAEEAQKDVNAKSNEFRGQLSDQAASLMPRRESEARSSELDRRIEEARTERGHQIDALNARIILLERGETGHTASTQTEHRHQDRSQPWMIWVAGAVMTIILALVVLVANVAFGG